MSMIQLTRGQEIILDRIVTALETVADNTQEIAESIKALTDGATDPSSLSPYYQHQSFGPDQNSDDDDLQF